MNGLTVTGLCVLIALLAVGLYLMNKAARTKGSSKVAILGVLLVTPGDYSDGPNYMGDRAAQKAAEAISKRLGNARAAIAVPGSSEHPSLVRTTRLISECLGTQLLAVGFPGGPMEAFAARVRKLTDPAVTTIDEAMHREMILPVRNELGPAPRSNLNVVLAMNRGSLAKAKRDFTGPGGYIDVKEPAYGSVHGLVIEYDPKSGRIYKRYFAEGC